MKKQSPHRHRPPHACTALRTTESRPVKHRLALLVPATAIAVACSFALAGCSTGYPDIAGVWKASDGSTTKTISYDGNCTNMFYRDGKVFPSAEPGMCHIIGTASGGDYIFQTVEGNRSAKYIAKFTHNDNTIDFTINGKHLVTLTKTTSAH